MKILISIFFVVFLILVTSKVKINILSLQKDRSSKKVDFDVNVGFYLLGIIKILSIHLRKEGIYFWGWSIPYKNLQMDNLKMKDFKMTSVLEFLKILDFKLNEFKVDLKIGTEDVLFTIFSVFAISTFLSLFFAINRKKVNRRNCYYHVMPIYNSNELSFRISLKLSINMMNFIKAFFVQKEKLQTKKNFRKVVEEKSALKI